MQAPQLKTTRCTLDRPVSEDAPLIATLMTDAVVRRYLGGPASASRVEVRTADLISGTRRRSWVVRLTDRSGQGVGLVEIDRHHDGLDDELSYEFLPSVWGQGVASEAVAAVVGHAFSHLGYQRLIAETQAGNLPSRRLLEKLGMVRERDVLRFGEAQVIYAIAG